VVSTIQRSQPSRLPAFTVVLTFICSLLQLPPSRAKVVPASECPDFRPVALICSRAGTFLPRPDLAHSGNLLPVNEPEPEPVNEPERSRERARSIRGLALALVLYSFTVTFTFTVTEADTESE
jgi:hypothetical protein